MSCVGEVKRSYLSLRIKKQKQLFLKHRAEVSGPLIFNMTNSKSHTVNFSYYWTFTGILKGLRANFLPSSFFVNELFIQDR